MTKFTNFLGSGWSFPPRFANRSGEVEMSTNERDIDESLQILLSTAPGERIMHPNFGCNLDDLLFSPINLSLITEVTDRIKTSILYHEPRIDVKEVIISDENILEGEIRVQIDYVIRSTNSRRNKVFPFYRAEGSLK